MTTLITAEIGMLTPGLPMAPDVAVAVEGDRIIAAGPAADLAARFPGAERAGGAGYALIPGLVNSHDHGRAVGTLPLGVPDDLLEVWLPGLWAQPALDPRLAARFEATQLLMSGVTATAHSHNPRDWELLGEDSDAAIRGYREAGIRVAFHPPIVDQNPLLYDGRDAFFAALPPEVRAAAERFDQGAKIDRAAYFAMLDDLFRRHHDAERHTVHVQASPAGGQWCSDDLIGAAVAWARERGARVQMHMLETRYQRAYARRRWGTSFIRHLDANGALGPWLTLAHMVWVDQEDIPLLADRGVGVAHNPSSNLRLRSGVAPVPELLAADVPLGVGLDGQGLDDDQDYLRELRLAWTLANRPGASSDTIAPEAVWRAGTTGGAAITFGPDVPLGRLAEGCLADLVLLDWRAAQGVWTDPEADPAEVLLRRAAFRHVAHVMVGGAWVVRGGRCITVDEAEAAAELREQILAQESDARHDSARAAKLIGPHIRRFYAGWE